jgi:hypothetical protein
MKKTWSKESRDTVPFNRYLFLLALVSPKFNPDEGRQRIKNLKSKGYENCRWYRA